MRKILDVVLPGNDVKVLDMAMGPVVWPFDSLTRDTPARTSVPSIVEDNQLFTRTHRAIYLQNRTSMFITWDYRRAREGAQKYRGGMVWHEGKITFKRDATLAGAVPVLLFYFSPSAQIEGTANTLLVKDAAGGRSVVPFPKGKPFRQEGFVAPGGFVTAGPCDIAPAFYAGAGTRFRYAAFSDAQTGRLVQLHVGLGEPGQKVKAGTEIAYRFAMATLGGERVPPEQQAAKLEEIGESFGLGGGERGVKASATAGTLGEREMFLTAQAASHEACLKVAPKPTIVDLPIRVRGVEDNGCAAVWSTARPFYRFVGVAEGSAWFQENVDSGSEIWAGNVFVCDNPAAKLTLVCDGQAEGRPPFLEVHNPTDQAIRAVLTSPAHAPLFGGTKLTVEVPAGASVRVPLKGKGVGR